MQRIRINIRKFSGFPGVKSKSGPSSWLHWPS